MNTLPMFGAYLMIRIFSYVDSPRPYLWWHLALDVGMIGIMLLIRYIFKRADA